MMLLLPLEMTLRPSSDRPDANRKKLRCTETSQIRPNSRSSIDVTSLRKGTQRSISWRLRRKKYNKS